MSDLASELKAIREQFGSLNPRIVLEAARPVEHPLHDRFEWDDAVAAEAHRLAQAGSLIRSVRLEFVDSAGTTQSVRRFYGVRAADAGEWDYDDLEEVMQDSFKRRLLLSEMQRRIDELVGQYGLLNEFWAMFRKALRRRKAS